MCGVVGIFSFKGEPVKNLKSIILKMNSMLRHRGPDQEGVFISKDNLCALGNTRLSITDPKCKIPLPLKSKNKNFVLTYNGEIFNYKSLKRNLKHKGCNFNTETDTEVLLEGLSLENLPFLQKLDGMWAFAYYNIKKKELILSRDLLGERHLFYSIIDGQIIFASEPQPIIYYLNLKKEELDINQDSIISSMFFYGCEQGQTLIKSIKRLLPGRNIITKVGNEPKEILFKKLHPERWFDFFSKNPTNKEIFEKFHNIMSESFLLRTPSDTAYFSALSGGIDSAIVALYNSRFGKKKIDTLFLNSFGGTYDAKKSYEQISEVESARITSSKLNTTHHEFDYNHEECSNDLLEMSKNCFDGMLDAAFITHKQIAKEVKRKKKKIIFMSEGLDELLGYASDYPTWEQCMYFSSRKIQLFATKLLSSSKYTRSILRKLGMSKFVINHSDSKNFYFSPIHSLSHSDFLSKIVPRKNHKNLIFSYGTIDSIYDDIVAELDFSQKMALSYCSKSLPDFFNLRTDKGYFGTSTECRLPFQDPKIVEFLISAPHSFRYSNKQAKFFARNIVKDFISPDVAFRKKHGMPFSPVKNLIYWENKLQVKDTIKESKVFDDLPFKKNFKDTLFNPKYGFDKFLWIIYCISKTADNLKKIKD